MVNDSDDEIEDLAVNDEPLDTVYSSGEDDIFADPSRGRFFAFHPRQENSDTSDFMWKRLAVRTNM